MGWQADLNMTSEPYSGFERVRVDPAQTGFFEGRMFRTFKELNVAASGAYVVQAVVPLNIILFGLEVSLDSGFLRLETVVGGTPSGVFAETLPVFGLNNMSAGRNRRAKQETVTYLAQVALTAGGTHTGGTVLDVVRVKSNQVGAHAASVGSMESSERGVGANT
jgi:hypothetical protein